MLVTTLMQVFKRQTTVIFFKVYLHHHSAAAGFFNLDQGQHLWTKKTNKQTKYTSIFLYLCYWFNIKYHSIALTLKPKRNSASYTLLHSPTELKLLNLKSAYTQPSWSAHPWCTTKWSLTGGGRLREKKSIIGDPVAVGLARKKGSILDLSILFLVPRFNGCL